MRFSLVPLPSMVDALHAAIAKSSNGALGAVIFARPHGGPLTLIDASDGDYSDVDGFCQRLFSRLDALAAQIRVRHHVAIAWYDGAAFPRGLEKYGLGQRYHVHVAACAIATTGAEAVEPDPILRALQLASASEGEVAFTHAMAERALRHPYDALAAAQYDPDNPSALTDAFALAFDLLMVDQEQRNQRRARDGV